MLKKVHGICYGLQQRPVVGDRHGQGSMMRAEMTACRHEYNVSPWGTSDLLKKVHGICYGLQQRPAVGDRHGQGSMMRADMTACRHEYNVSPWGTSDLPKKVHGICYALQQRPVVGDRHGLNLKMIYLCTDHDCVPTVTECTSLRNIIPAKWGTCYMLWLRADMNNLYMVHGKDISLCWPWLRVDSNRMYLSEEHHTC